jgi:hypothetical protein
MQAKGMQGESPKQVAIDLFRRARGPLHASEVATRVIDSDRSYTLSEKVA